MKPTPEQPTLAWTGERMIPSKCDPATEMFHYQRYLYFRPWYAGRKVVDAASGEGYGTYYASAFAAEAQGYDISREAVRYASTRYKGPRFTQKDVCEADYSDADLVVSFETIEHLPDPGAFLGALGHCKGGIVISTPNREIVSPGNKLSDKPLNPHHTIEWNAAEFKALIEKAFSGRRVRFLSQPMRWPGTVTEGLDPKGMFLLAVIDGWELPQWPSLGISIPTCNPQRALNAVTAISKLYPGKAVFALVANGCSPQDVTALRDYGHANPHLTQILTFPENRGYGIGANAGLEALKRIGGFDYYGVSNDDVFPALDCFCELVCCYRELEAQGYKPGMIGPVSNSVNGSQQVDIGAYKDIDELIRRSEIRHHAKHDSVSAALQVRGLCFLMSDEAFRTVGGFDPRFGLGNFEDDDLNLRLRAAGFTLWIADGAFLHHDGSATFKQLGLDYNLSIQRNLELILEKWGATDFSELIVNGVKAPPANLRQPLAGGGLPSSGYRVAINGEVVDLIYQASNLEFASWLAQSLNGQPREARFALIEAVERRAVAA